MVFFNYATMQMAAKIVYYGPGLCGKTTNLHFIYGKTAPTSRGEMVSLETETDRTLFFDLLPLDVGVIGGFKTRLQLYTVPGQVFYNTTRKLVLKGVDGLVFVMDSQRPMLEANVESLRNLKENIAEIGLTLDQVPLVLQYNKRDLPNILSVEELDRALNPNHEYETHEACAVSGLGVFETLKGISKLTLKALRKRMTGDDKKPPAVIAKLPPPRPAAAPGGPSRIAQGLSDLQAKVKSGVVPALVSPLPVPPSSANRTMAIPAPTLRDGGVVGAPAAGRSAAASPPGKPASPASAASNEELEVIEEIAEEVTLDAVEDSGAPVPAAAAAATAASRSEAAPVEEEVSFAETPDSTPVAAPELKRVKVRSNADIFAELDNLRKKSTAGAAPAEPAREARPAKAPKAPKVEELLGGNGRGSEISKELQFLVRRGDLGRSARCRVSITLEDGNNAPLSKPESYEVPLKNAKDLERLLLNLRIKISSE